MEAKFQGLRTIGYHVANITAAKEWYTKILGIEPYFDQPFYVGFNVAGYELGLQPMEEGQGTKSNNTVTYWGVDNVHEMYNDLLDEGATPHGEPMDVGDGIIVASVRDPWGNAFGIIYNPHFKL
jgi:lactoylglutathione lyase